MKYILVIVAITAALLTGVTTAMGSAITVRAEPTLHRHQCSSDPDVGTCTLSGSINGAEINNVPQKGGGTVTFGNPGHAILKCKGSPDFKQFECS
ncbi:MAG TPA: hypothetical protein VIW25_11845 [Nitrososphaeraceae archaeon]|jgi:hypothetical protein